VSFLGIPVTRALFGADDARVAVYFAVLNVPLAILSAAIISGRISRLGQSGGVGGTGEPGTRARPTAATPVGFLLAAGRQFFSLPATWALVAGVALHGVPVPAAIQQIVHTLSASVAPTVMFALGMGLRFERSLAPYRMALPAVAIKLAISPLVVFACARVVGLTGSGLAIVALQGAMPTQVLSVVIAERYHLDSRVVGLALAMNTALAFVLLPLLVAGMQAAGIR
jgi:predicted permease